MVGEMVGMGTVGVVDVAGEAVMAVSTASAWRSMKLCAVPLYASVAQCWSAAGAAGGVYAAASVSVEESVFATAAAPELVGAEAVGIIAGRSNISPIEGRTVIFSV